MSDSILPTPEFRARLLDQRTRFGLSYIGLGQLTGLNRDTLFRLEHQDDWRCSRKTYRRLCAFLEQSDGMPGFGTSSRRHPAPELQRMLATFLETCRILEASPALRQRLLRRCWHFLHPCATSPAPPEPYRNSGG